MQEGKPSFTAEVGAVIRTVETEKPEGERICYDPFAKTFLGPSKRVIGAIPPLRSLALRYLDKKHPGILDCIPARTRYIDDCVSRSIAEGIEQLIILGAGYDSRARRLKRPEGGLAVFEVDHPATQKVKLERVRRMLGTLPDDVVYVPIDFEKETLSDRLFQSGYSRDKASLFIWEGVTPLLTEQAVDETLRFIAENSGPGSSVVFNYILKSVVDGTCQVEGAAEIRRAFSRGGILDLASNRGDRLQFGLDEGAIGPFLAGRGFDQVEDISGDYYEENYFRGPNQHRKGCRLCRVVYAAVRPPN